MKILSWNLYNFYDWKYFLDLGLFQDKNQAQNFVENRIRYYKTEILKISPDIIYFYEVGDSELLKRLAIEIFGKEFCIFETTPDRRGIYNACVSKVKLENSEIFLDNLEIPNFVITEQSYTNKYLLQKRGYIKTELNYKGSNLNIYAVHLKSQLPSRIKIESGEDYEPKNSLEKARAEILGELTGLAEAYALRKIISIDIENKNEVIIMGDFNADFKSKRIKILTGGEEMEDEMLSIFDFKDTDNYSYVYKNHKSLLDYVLCSKNIFENIKDQNLHTSLINIPDGLGYIDTKIAGSDHAPISFALNA